MFGLARNARLVRAIGAALHQAKQQFEQTGNAARLFREILYQTRKTWSRPRRVVAKAEHLSEGSNPRFVVTSLQEDAMEGKALYKDLYGARVEMENRIKPTLYHRLRASRPSGYSPRVEPENGKPRRYRLKSAPPTGVSRFVQPR